MNTPEQQLGWLEASLGRAVGDAFAAALAVEEPAGGSPEWSQILQIWSISPIPDDERHRARNATGMTHGAPADEVYAVLTRIGEWATSHLPSHYLPNNYDVDGPLERRRDKLRTRIDELRNEWLARYKKQVMPAPAGGMFAHAMAAAQSGSQAVSVARRTVILRCQNCAGPRLTEDLYECEFCGHHLGEKGPRRQW